MHDLRFIENQYSAQKRPNPESQSNAWETSYSFSHEHFREMRGKKSAFAKLGGRSLFSFFENTWQHLMTFDILAQKENYEYYLSDHAKIMALTKCKCQRSEGLPEVLKVGTRENPA